MRPRSGQRKHVHNGDHIDGPNGSNVATFSGRSLKQCDIGQPGPASATSFPRRGKNVTRFGRLQPTKPSWNISWLAGTNWAQSVVTASAAACGNSPQLLLAARPSWASHGGRLALNVGFQARSSSTRWGFSIRLGLDQPPPLDHAGPRRANPQAAARRRSANHEQTWPQ